MLFYVFYNILMIDLWQFVNLQIKKFQFYQIAFMSKREIGHQLSNMRK